MIAGPRRRVSEHAYLTSGRASRSSHRRPHTSIVQTTRSRLMRVTRRRAKVPTAAEPQHAEHARTRASPPNESPVVPSPLLLGAIAEDFCTAASDHGTSCLNKSATLPAKKLIAIAACDLGYGQ